MDSAKTNVRQCLHQISKILDEVRIMDESQIVILKTKHTIREKIKELCGAMLALEEHEGISSSKITSKETEKDLHMLLSLVDYTNITCLLELFVRIYVLLPMDGHLLYSRDTPKMIAGRLPKWNWKNIIESGMLSVQDQEPRVVAVSLADALDDVSRICLLQRFQPMLLPRHLVDIYTGYFFADSYSCKFNAATISLLKFDDDRNTSDEQHILDARSAAVVLRTLLSRCSMIKSPNITRVKSGAVKMLTEITKRNFDAILETFVPCKMDNPGVSYRMEAAAARLAVTLVGTPKTTHPIFCRSLLHRCANISIDGLETEEILKTKLHQHAAPYILHSMIPMLDSLTCNQCIIEPLLSPVFLTSSTSNRFFDITEVLNIMLSILNAAPSNTTFVRMILKYGYDLNTETIGKLVEHALNDEIIGRRSKIKALLVLILRDVPVSFASKNILKSLVQISKGHVLDTIEPVCYQSIGFIVQCLKETSTSQREVNKLISSIFYILLSSYLSSLLQTGEENEEISKSQRFLINSPEEKIVLFTMLTILSEKCELNELIDSGKSILLVICRVISYSSNVNHLYDETSDELQSIISICLSLLVAILELGVERRNIEEETILNTFLSPLSILASTEINQDPTLAEMAGHCCALIASRSIESDSDANSKGGLRESKSFAERIAVIESDFKSSSIPIRARGAVRLQHLARATVLSHDSTVVSRTIKPLIQEIDPSQDISNRFEFPINLELEKLLGISVNALNDGESYVYLAAIQAISALADVHPGYIIPKLLHALAHGQINMRSSTETVSNTQRAKIAEAMIHIIRRRGSALNHHLNDIVHTLLNGSRIIHLNDILIENRNKVLATTSNYFKFGINDSEEVERLEDHVMKEINAEQDIRLNTGGPVFTIEENALVKSSCIACLAELFQCGDATIMAKFVQIILPLCIDSLQLSKERQVRRAAALLARNIYDGILREAQSTMLHEPHLPFSTIAIELLSPDCKEDTLQQVLHLNSSAKCSEKGYDAATEARCKEAIQVREELIEYGVFQVAVMTQEKSTGSSNFLQFLTNAKNQELRIEHLFESK